MLGNVILVENFHDMETNCEKMHLNRRVCPTDLLLSSPQCLPYLDLLRQASQALF